MKAYSKRFHFGTALICLLALVACSSVQPPENANNFGNIKISDCQAADRRGAKIVEPQRDFSPFTLSLIPGFMFKDSGDGLWEVHIVEVKFPRGRRWSCIRRVTLSDGSDLPRLPEAIEASQFSALEPVYHEFVAEKVSSCRRRDLPKVSAVYESFESDFATEMPSSNCQLFTESTSMVFRVWDGERYVTIMKVREEFRSY